MKLIPQNKLNYQQIKEILESQINNEYYSNCIEDIKSGKFNVDNYINEFLEKLTKYNCEVYTIRGGNGFALSTDKGKSSCSNENLFFLSDTLEDYIEMKN